MVAGPPPPGLPVADRRAVRDGGRSRVDRQGPERHRPDGRDRGGRDGAGHPARRDRAADRRPGRVRRGRGPAADRHAAPPVGSGSTPRAGSASPTGRRDSGPTQLVVHGHGSAAGAGDPPRLAGRGAGVAPRGGDRPGRRASHKLGDRWRAEVEVGAAKVVVIGQPGAGIASTTLAEGRTATVIGIVRRPYPSATDQRFAVTPRSPADIRVAGRADADAGARDRHRAAGTTSPASGDRAPDPATAAPDADLVDLDTLIGGLVRVGGLVVDLRPDGFTLDDGTAIGRVVLRGPALERLALIEPDDALNAIGRVEAGDGRRSSSSTIRRASSRPATPSRGPGTPPEASSATVHGLVRHARDARWLGRSARRPGRRPAGRRRDRRLGHTGRDLGRVGGRDRPPTGRSRDGGWPPGSPARSGHVRRHPPATRRRPSAASVAERGPSTIHSA